MKADFKRYDRRTADFTRYSNVMLTLANSPVSPFNVKASPRLQGLRLTAAPLRCGCGKVAEQTPACLAETVRRRALRGPEVAGAANQRVVSRATQDAIFTSLPVLQEYSWSAHVRGLNLTKEISSKVIVKYSG